MRYIAKPATAWWGWDDETPISAPTTQVEPTPAQFTGLLNAQGHQIWVEPDPIGFRFQDQD